MLALEVLIANAVVPLVRLEGRSDVVAAEVEVDHPVVPSRLTVTPVNRKPKIKLGEESAPS